MNVVRLYLLLFSVFLVCPLVNGQGAIEKKSKLNDKLFFGGGVGMYFGSVTSIDLSPMIGFKPTDKFYFGLKGTYQYVKDNNYNFSTDIYGGSIFGLYVFFDKVVAFAEYEVVSLESRYYNTQIDPEDDRFWVDSPMIGGGLSQSVGSRSKVLILLLWNLNNSGSSPYSNPIVRVSFLF